MKFVLVSLLNNTNILMDLNNNGVAGEVLKD
jgi:hypothetical protein